MCLRKCMNECVIVMLFLERFLNVLGHSYPPPLTGHRAWGRDRGAGWVGWHGLDGETPTLITATSMLKRNKKLKKGCV